jgi:NAD(P)-dependent dehydrogenase (short-subunit alcohol dehydrogenase family)
MEVDGKVVVITGGASGIGRGTALAMARQGAVVVIADVNDERLEETRAAIAAVGGRVLAMHCDVSRDADVDRLAAVVLAEMGQVDILMNNAGVVLCGALEEIPIADWEWQFGINVLGVVRGIRAFLPHMVARGSGYIVNTGSVAGLLALTGAGAPYIASKFAVVGLSEALALYAGPHGIGVSVLCSGAVETNLSENGRVVGMTPASLAADNAASTAILGVAPTTPDRIGQLVVDAVRENRFLILSDSHHQDLTAQRAQDLNAFLRMRLDGPPGA